MIESNPVAHSEQQAQLLVKKNAEILEMIATGQSASEIYNAIALMYEARHQGMRCSLLELKENKLKHGGAPSLPKEYCDAVNGLQVGPSVGSCGTSTYSGKRVLVENIETDPKWAQIKQAALPHGIRCCWSEPIKDSNGKVLGAFGMYYNHPALPNENELADLQSGGRLAGIIMERDQREIALRQSEKKYRALFENSNDGIILHDLNGIIKNTNYKIEQMLGYEKDELIGISIQRLHSKSEIDTSKRAFDQIMRVGHTIFDSEFKTKDGTIIQVNINSNIFDDNAGMVHEIIRDISEQKKLEAKLQQSQKMESIGTLASGIAHDFNNILFPILGHAEMLLEDLPDDDPSKDSVHEIYSGSLRAKDLIEQILTFSRQENSELKLIKIQPIIQEALTLIRSTIPTTIEIKQNIQKGCGVIKADPTQIHQITMNLATNAYHAMEEECGELNVSLKEVELRELDLINPDMKPGIYACLTVVDTGKGMDKNLMDKIFDPYFTTKKNGKGTGIGLSVVHGIVKSMCGDIQVYSEPDIGTEFRVYLPVIEGSFEKQATNAKGSIMGGTESILLVDDEEAILLMEKQMLERLGYGVTSRTSSIEALEAFRKDSGKFDLVITDMAMPNMPGDKFAAELNKINPEIPVLLCTGFSETMSEEKAESLFINGLLFKPIVKKDFSKKIREILDKKST